MRVTRLTLTNVRALRHVEFEFQSGMNLLVGVNGAGKSTVLDALRIMFSQALPRLTSAAPRQVMSFDRHEDISVGQPDLTVSTVFEIGEVTLDHTVLLQREAYMADPRAALGQVRDQAIALPERDDLRTLDGQPVMKSKRSSGDQPLVVYFSPQRSAIERGRGTARSGTEAAFVDALKARGVKFSELGQWWLVQEELAKEDASKKALLHALDGAIRTFLPGYANLRAVREPQVTLVLDKGGITLDARQLSDGERSMIALIVDLARRLTLANPHAKEPLRDCGAVVLIDEIDLHLHPGWQRTICERLVRTFPRCQFIATTHSPQILGEVAPEAITLIEDGGATRPDQSLGMDTNWILRHLMRTDERDADTKQELSAIEALIDNEQYAEATARITTLRTKLGEFPDLVEIQTRIDMISFLGTDEGDTV